MNFLDNEISFKKRTDGRYDVLYAGEAVLVIERPPMTEFRKKMLKVLLRKTLTELNDAERIDFYKKSENSETS